MSTRPVFSIAWLLVAVAYVGLGLAAIVLVQAWAIKSLAAVVWGSLIYAGIRAWILDGPSRAASRGFLVAAVVYLVFATWPTVFSFANPTKLVEAIAKPIFESTIPARVALDTEAGFQAIPNANATSFKVAPNRTWFKYRDGWDGFRLSLHNFFSVVVGCLGGLTARLMLRNTSRDKVGHS